MKTMTITDIMVDFLDSIRAYEHESGKSIHFDERESSEFVDIYFNNGGKLKTEKPTMENLEKLTKEMAIKEVADIRNIASDDETVHSNEDSLHYWFICCVAAGMYEKDEAAEVANIVKSTSEIEFARWCV